MGSALQLSVFSPSTFHFDPPTTALTQNIQTTLAISTSTLENE